ncbi:MAG: hypothetical protein A3E31_08460 [Candidatus Rokubacteria bacterium RIFCSPHIGHO2_12_FULL_73_22]|nr:MAG: hypothetical protein A3D33_03655 [Candidatus Rokubacteria bacterium RIFCSPHIGHO2_02_FULL_73_26]OGL02904.1 MAG: hypothetical protein A3E31_08460 [Candidatus Rokubacteria bacterium RIFCSPHIGHO2_12_FULL_73_22]OGL08873.1 MAG: hypothetical protein A3I14_06740 [Candidatus Rokubacteria bacterium RIFCSPLOWO2_02_FULL_73_56]OGL30162.1 MAG: hypothetical protein A3G44_00755 [Candidatus Rokubacteria bacterium RIFCSPLOWO2_12_FULL_73_47]
MSRARRPHGGRRAERGFTLAELLVACAVVGFVMAGLLVMLQSGQETYLVGAHQVEAQQSVRLAVERMVAELRDAGFCPTCAATPTSFAAITGQSATGFTIQSDWDASWDGTAGIDTAAVTDAAGTLRGERIVYSLSGTDLQRQEIGIDATPLTVASGVSSLSFDYMDAGGAATAVDTSIRTVTITLSAAPRDQPAATSTGRVFVTMSDSVRLRNRVP